MLTKLATNTHIKLRRIVKYFFLTFH